MKAVVLTKTCKSGEMQINEVPVPFVKPGWVLVKVKAEDVDFINQMMHGNEK